MLSCESLLSNEKRFASSKKIKEFNCSDWRESNEWTMRSYPFKVEAFINAFLIMALIWVWCSWSMPMSDSGLSLSASSPESEEQLFAFRVSASNCDYTEWSLSHLEENNVLEVSAKLIHEYFICLVCSMHAVNLEYIFETQAMVSRSCISCFEVFGKFEMLYHSFELILESLLIRSIPITRVDDTCVFVEET